MSIANILLVCSINSNNQTRIHANQEIKDSKKKSLTYTVLIITVLFILLTLPDNILSLILTVLLAEDYGIALLYSCDCLAFSYHGLHFLILVLSNKKFSSEFKVIFRRIRPSTRVSNMSTLNPIIVTNI